MCVVPTDTRKSTRGGAATSGAPSATIAAHPYKLPVVPGFKPSGTAAASTAARTKKLAATLGHSASRTEASREPHAAGKRSTGADGDTLVPSHIGELDLLRIREAERVIEADEKQFGKVLLDEVRDGACCGTVSCRVVAWRGVARSCLCV
jgi:hypothetical protein